MGKHKKLLQFLRPDPAVAAVARSSSTTSDDEDDYDNYYGSTSTSTSTPTTPYAMSPWTQLPGLCTPGGAADAVPNRHRTGLLGSLVKEDGHVYSLAAAGDLLYTGTDSRSVRVWRDRRELGGFRSGSGLVKAIVVSADGRIYTGHQDGKVRVWRAEEHHGHGHGPAATVSVSVQHLRVGSLPRLRDVLRSSLRPSQYVQTRRRQSSLWMRHFDAVSSLSLDAAAGLIYSASWDRTFKVWRRGPRQQQQQQQGTGCAGRKQRKGVDTWHTMERVLREGDGAVTAIAVCPEARVVYVGASDGSVAHWQWRRGAGPGAAPRNGGALRGHKMAVLCLAVAGRVVVSGSADRTISVWRRQEGADHARLAVLTGHTGPVKCVAMDEEEPDGSPRRWVVYSGSLDGSAKVWRVSDDSNGSGGGGAPDLTATTPARYLKGTSPSPLLGSVHGAHESRLA